MTLIAPIQVFRSFVQRVRWHKIESFTKRERFCACDGSARVVIETTTEDDARDLCNQMGWEFVGMCGG